MPPALQRFSRPRISVATAGYAGLSDTSDAVLVGATIPLEQTLNDNLMRRFRRAARYPGLTVYIRIP